MYTFLVRLILLNGFRCSVFLNTCCFLYKSLIMFYTFDPICIMRGTFMKYLVKVFIFTVQAEQS